MITAVIPTIDGREDYLERAVASLDGCEILVYRNRSTCGVAWNEGMREATGDYILLAADDLEAHEGWAEVAIPWVDRGVLPCPRILNTDGSLQSCGPDANEHETGTPSDVARVPFFSREMLERLYPVFEHQYCGDYWITWKAQQHGWPTQVVREMIFTHHLALEGRLDTLAEDWISFTKAKG